MNSTKSLHPCNSIGNMTHHRKLFLYHNQIRLWIMTNSNAVDLSVSLLHYAGTCPVHVTKQYAVCFVIYRHSSSLDLEHQTS